MTTATCVLSPLSARMRRVLTNAEVTMRSFLPLLCLVMYVSSHASDLVNIDSGYLVGSGTTVRVYKGIPFAAPPVGELRWRAPQPVKPWDSLRLAKAFALSCPQPPAAVPKERM